MSALSGSLDHFMPVQVLRLLQAAGCTGRLEISRRDEHADLYVIDGRSGFALTNAVHVRVGDVLVDGGDIHPEAMDLVVALQRDQPRVPIGRMLIDNGVVGRERLREAVLEVQRRIVCSVLLWQEGRFTFHAGERANDEDILLDLDLDRLIVEALRFRARAGLDEPTERAA